MIKYPSVDQFRNVIKAVEYKARWAGYDEEGNPKFDRTVDLPTLKFRATVKLHGTNAAWNKNMVTEELIFQSRERELSLTSDNAGFMLYMSSKTGFINELIDQYISIIQPTEQPKRVVVFGEWCGSTVQKGVALSQLEKMFVIFGCKFFFDSDEGEDSGYWIDLEKVKHIVSHEARIYNIMNYQTWEFDIDFNKPHEVQNKLVELSLEVENECPVGKAFGVSGIGEGVVCQCIEPGWNGSAFRFKVKGEKHSASKVKVLAAVDVEAINSLNEFVDSVVTENRLEQMLGNLQTEKLLPFEMTSMGEFIRLVYQDIMKEETDTIIANQLDPKKLGGPIANKARKWFIQKFNASVGLN